MSIRLVPMKIVLVNPNARDFPAQGPIDLPLDLLGLASEIRPRGHRVSFVDANRDGLGAEEVGAIVRARDADVVVVAGGDGASATAAGIRAVNPDTVTVLWRGGLTNDLEVNVVGGFDPDDMSWIGAISSMNLGWPWPFPSLDLAAPLEAYPAVAQGHVLPSVPIRIADGQSARRTLLELAHLDRLYGPCEIRFLDDALNAPDGPAEGIFEGVARTGLARRTSLSVSFDAALVDEDLLRRATAANVRSITYRIAPETRANLDAHERAIRLTHEAGIRTMCVIELVATDAARERRGDVVALAMRLAPFMCEFEATGDLEACGLEAADEMRRFHASPEYLHQRANDLMAVGYGEQGARMTAALHVLDQRAPEGSSRGLMPHEVLVDLLVPTVTLGEDDRPSLGGGWFGPERDGDDSYRWMGRLARVYVPYEASGRIEIDVEAYLSPSPDGEPMRALRVDVDGAPAGRFEFTGRRRRRTVTVAVDGPDVHGGHRCIDLVPSGVDRPSACEPDCGDERELSFRVFSVRSRSSDAAQRAHQEPRPVRDRMRLNVGCGPDTRPDHINLDMNAGPGVDVVCDVSRLPFAGESMDGMLADDILEHFPHRMTRDVLAEWRRVLATGGDLVIRTPSLEGVIDVYENRPEGWGREDGEHVDPVVIRLYGGQDFDGNTHYTIFDIPSLGAVLHDLGFTILELGFDGHDVTNLSATAVSPHYS
jgi:methyltransferase family protein